jgi:hypothetical protein
MVLIRSITPISKKNYISNLALIRCRFVNEEKKNEIKYKLNENRNIINKEVNKKIKKNINKEI